VWLVTPHATPSAATNVPSCAPARDGRLTMWPGRNHVTFLADTTILARIVLDAAIVAEAATPAGPGS
jgi:hypothetical protein